MGVMWKVAGLNEPQNLPRQEGVLFESLLHILDDTHILRYGQQPASRR